MQIYFLEIELRLFRVHSGQGKPGKPGKRAVFPKSQGKLYRK